MYLTIPGWLCRTSTRSPNLIGIFTFASFLVLVQWAVSLNTALQGEHEQVKALSPRGGMPSSLYRKDWILLNKVICTGVECHTFDEMLFHSPTSIAFPETFAIACLGSLISTLQPWRNLHDSFSALAEHGASTRSGCLEIPLRLAPRRSFMVCACAYFKGLKFKSLFCELEIINQGPFTVGGSCLGVNEYLTPNNVNREGEWLVWGLRLHASYWWLLLSLDKTKRSFEKLTCTTRTHQVELIFCPRQFISEKRAGLLCSNSCDQDSGV